MAQGDFQYAMVLIEKAIALNDTDAWLLLDKAQVEFELNGPLYAVDVVNEAIALDPKFGEAYNRSGSYYESAGMIDSAIFMYDKAITFALNDTAKHSYILNRGTAKGGRQDFKGALADYEEVLKFNPNDISVLNNIAPVYRQLGMPDKAIASMKKVIALDSTFIGPYINLGFLYSKFDSLEMAIQFFDKALTIDPNEALVYNNRGYVYYQLGDYGKALKDINHSLTLYPTNAYAYRNLGLVYIGQGNMNEACMALRYALDYGFTQRYGNEVEELSAKHCKK